MNSAGADAIEAAVNILRKGGLVAFATETVYGLGADATNPLAIQRIYAAKGRPATNPLIVHVSDEAMARKYTTHWPPEAHALARAFWPGPLTLVVPRSGAIAPQVSAGLNTIGVRAPNHPLAQALLRAFDGPIAAPSANRSNRVSPTTAEHVRAELGDEVDLILDGGACEVGIESTVVDVSGPRAKVLRPGSVTREQLAGVIGQVETTVAHVEASQAALSPGQQAVHYAPRTPAFRFSSEDANCVIVSCSEGQTLPLAILHLEGSASVAATARAAAAHRVIMMPRDPVAYARLLYATLHELDAGSFAAIYIELPEDEPAWAAIRDRLLRCTTGL